MIRVYTTLTLVLCFAINHHLKAQSEPILLLSKIEKPKIKEKEPGLLSPRRFESRFKSSKHSIGVGISSGYFDAYIEDPYPDTTYSTYEEVYATGLGLFVTFSKRVLWNRLKFNGDLGANVYRSNELKATTLYLDTYFSFDVMRVHVFSCGLDFGLGMLATKLKTDKDIYSPDRYVAGSLRSNWFFRAEISETQQLKLAFVYREAYFWNSESLLNFSYSHKF